MYTLSNLAQAKRLHGLMRQLRTLGDTDWALGLVTQDNAVLFSVPDDWQPRLDRIWLPLADRSVHLAEDQITIRLDTDQGTFALVARASADALPHIKTIGEIVANEINRQAEQHGLAQELIHRYGEINLLYNIGETIGSSLNLAQVCQLVLQESGRIIEADRGAVALWDENRFLIKTSYGLKAGQEPVFLQAAEQTLFSGKPEILEPSDTLPDMDMPLLCAPLKAKDKVLGALVLAGKKAGEPFTASDIKLLMALTRQTATAIENARLYTVTDQALTTRLGELYILQEIDRQLNASLDTSQIIDLSLEWALRSTQAIAGLIALIDPEQDNRILAAQGYDDRLQGTRLPGDWLAQEIITQMIERRKPVVVSDTRDESTYVPLTLGMRSQLAMPLQRENRPIGIIYLESSQPDIFGQDDIDFITRLADHTTVAVENARLYEQIRQANEAKSEFVSTVAHELKVPMTAIKGFVSLLRRDPSIALKDIHLGYLQIIEKNVNHMNSLINDLLDIAQLEAGTIEIIMEPISLDKVINQVCDTMGDWIHRKKQILLKQLDPDLPLVLANQERLEQVLTNLVSNAIKYTPEHGQLCISARLNGATDKVQIQVSDTGIGISAQDQERLFAKFFRSEQPEVQEQEGTGLGLSIVKQIVEAHNSEIIVKSQPGRGTTFTFALPGAL